MKANLTKPADEAIKKKNYSQLFQTSTAKSKNSRSNLGITSYKSPQGIQRDETSKSSALARNKPKTTFTKESSLKATRFSLGEEHGF